MKNLICLAILLPSLSFASTFVCLSDVYRIDLYNHQLLMAENKEDASAMIITNSETGFQTVILAKNMGLNQAFDAEYDGTALSGPVLAIKLVIKEHNIAFGKESYARMEISTLIGKTSFNMKCIRGEDKLPK